MSTRQCLVICICILVIGKRILWVSFFATQRREDTPAKVRY
ncbi:hypothetical protein X975_02883, partial [Stegodyphus mimosarum]